MAYIYRFNIQFLIVWMCYRCAGRCLSCSRCVMGIKRIQPAAWKGVWGRVAKEKGREFPTRSFKASGRMPVLWTYDEYDHTQNRETDDIWCAYLAYMYRFGICHSQAGGAGPKLRFFSDSCKDTYYLLPQYWRYKYDSLNWYWYIDIRHWSLGLQNENGVPGQNILIIDEVSV